MSAGFRGAERVRRVRRVECGGDMEWVWRLDIWVSRAGGFGGRDNRALGRGGRVEGEEQGVPQDV